MSESMIVTILQVVVLLYFVGLQFGYIVLMLSSFLTTLRYLPRRVLDGLPQSYEGLEPPISILVPAYNEEGNIVGSVRSLLQLQYSDFEVLVINDGSRDGTLQALTEEFGLYEFPEDCQEGIVTQPVHALYRSRSHPRLRVINKANGGKADSLNAGINLARYAIVCSIDADSMLQPNSLRLVAQPFLEDPATVASGGTVRIANGCHVVGGFLVKAGLPPSFLAQMQIVEYLRAFQFGRMGWAPLNAITIISGAFGLFRRDSVIAVGGYRTDTIGEDMDLILRLHKHYRLLQVPYRIHFVPDPICWTEAPTDLKTLGNQRSRWQRGLAESLAASRPLFFHRRGGSVGWLALPFTALFELIGPVIETAGYLLVVVGMLFGLISLEYMLLFSFVSIGLGILLSIAAFLLEELTFHIYPKVSHVLRLVLAAVLENLGYRQLTLYWRMRGLWRWMKRKERVWGEMKRTSSLGASAVSSSVAEATAQD
ncbi:MAG: glycosyltransferase [Ignavibacteria bacterium]|nr:glycosyltransferase [Ignavibacteria bacterium]